MRHRVSPSGDTLATDDRAELVASPRSGSSTINITLTALGLVAGSIAGSIVRSTARGSGRLIGTATSKLIEGVGALSGLIPGGGGTIGTALRFACAGGGAVASAAIESSVEAVGEGVGVGVSVVVAIVVSGVGAAVVAATNVAIAVLPPPGAQDGCSSPSPWADGGTDPPSLLVELLHGGGVREHSELPEPLAFYPPGAPPLPSAPAATTSFEDPCGEDFCVVPRTPRHQLARFVLIPPKPVVNRANQKQCSDSGDGSGE